MGRMNLHGVFAPVPTPFDDEERFDARRFRRALARWASSALGGVVVLGSTGEAVLVDEHEADEVIDTARQAWPRDRVFLVGTGRESTAATIRASRRAAELGADGVLVRTPGFYKAQMTAEAFVRHYRAVADASPVPILLYNFTAVTGVNIQPAAVAALAAHPNIVGIKESGTDVAQLADFVNGTPAGFAVLGGSATVFMAALAVGAAGGILALACVVPDLCVRLFNLAAAGRSDEARALQQALVPLARLIGPIYGIGGLKAASALAGYDAGRPRSPLPVMPEAGIAALGEALATLSSHNLQLTTD